MYLFNHSKENEKFVHLAKRSSVATYAGIIISAFAVAFIITLCHWFYKMQTSKKQHEAPYSRGKSYQQKSRRTKKHKKQATKKPTKQARREQDRANQIRQQEFQERLNRLLGPAPEERLDSTSTTSTNNNTRIPSCATSSIPHHNDPQNHSTRTNQTEYPDDFVPPYTATLNDNDMGYYDAEGQFCPADSYRPACPPAAYIT